MGVAELHVVNKTVTVSSDVPTTVFILGILWGPGVGGKIELARWD